MIELYETIEKLNENVPETADVGDGGSMFAPATRAYKRPRLEKIHRAIKKQSPPRKRICLGGGRVSGRSRENLITSLLPRGQQPVDVSSEGVAPRERHLPPSFLRQGTGGAVVVEVRRYSEIHAEIEAAAGLQQPGELSPASFFSSILGPTVSIGIPRWQARLHADMEARRYSEMHGETEAAAPHVRTSLATRWDSGYSTNAETLGTHPEGLAPTTIPQRDGLEVDVAPTTIRQRDGLEVDVALTTIPQLDGLEVDVAPTTIRQRDGLEVDVAPTPGAPPAAGQEAFAPTPASQPIQASSSTQTGSLMLQSYAYEDTRSGYNDADDFEYPLN